MNYCPKEWPRLCRLGVYTSPPGGSPSPYTIEPGYLYFEVLTEGAVFGFEDPPLLHPVGTIFVHRPGDSTIYRTEGQARYTSFFLASELMSSFPLQDWPRCYLWDDASTVRKFADDMVRAYHDEAIPNAIVNSLLWSQFCFRLEQAKHRTKLDQVPDPIAQVIAHMDAHYAEPLTVVVLAERVGLSASHTQALFRKTFGLSIHQYLIQVRMNAAVNLLVTTNEPIKALATEVGYANMENFCRAFKKRTGLTAAAYRKKYAIA